MDDFNAQVNVISRLTIFAASIVAVLLFTPPAACDRFGPHFSLPDPLTVADSSRGAALVSCFRSGTDQEPARFIVLQHLGGVLPDTLEAYPRTGESFLANERYQLLLRNPGPPVAPLVRATFGWRREAAYEVWPSSRLTWSPRWSGSHADTDSALFAFYQALWQLPRLSAAQYDSVLAGWIDSQFRAWACEALRRHPEIWGARLRATFLHHLSTDEKQGREWAARYLAQHPDSLTREKCHALMDGDASAIAIAVVLASLDSSAEARHGIIDAGNLMLSRLPGALPDFYAGMKGPQWRETLEMLERMTDTLSVLDNVVEALSPPRSQVESAALVDIARRVAPTYPLRYATLGALCADTATIVRRMIRETVNAHRWSDEDEPRLRDITRCWTRAELHAALSDSSLTVRSAAYAEAGRRRDFAAGDTLRQRLDRLPLADLTAWQRGEAQGMILALGQVGDSQSLLALLRWGSNDDDPDTRRMVIEAVGAIGDPRGAAWLRQVASAPCSTLRDDIARSLATALSTLGGASDLATFRRWVDDCPALRETAFEAVGVLGGAESMVKLMRASETAPLGIETMRSYESIESSVRARLASTKR